MFGQFGDGCELPAFQHLFPAEGAGERLDEGAVDTNLLDGRWGASRRNDPFLAAVFADTEQAQACRKL